MTISTLADLSELFRLMNEHGIARVQLEGLTVSLRLVSKLPSAKGG